VFVTPDPRQLDRVPFGALVEQGFMDPGQTLFLGEKGDITATVLADGAILYNGKRGTIHEIAREIRNGPSNGWTLWYYWDETSLSRQPIDKLRQAYRNQAVQQIASAEEQYKKEET